MTVPNDMQRAAANPNWDTRYKRYIFADGIDPALQAIFRSAEQQLLYSRVVKNSRSTSAGVFGADGQKYFVKRSNVNTFCERIRRIGRLSRAERNFLASKKLESLGIRTPKVYMALMTGPAWLPGASYLITECLAEPVSVSRQLEEVCQAYGGKEKFIAAAAEMIYRMHSNGVEHGDLKMTNLYWESGDNGAQRLGVFDLDSSCVYSSGTPGRICCKELARAASSFCIYALDKGLIKAEEVDSARALWCREYAQAGGADYSKEQYFLQRFGDFMPQK